MSLFQILMLALLTEAMVNLFFLAEPLSKIRGMLISRTEFLRVNDIHLLECKYCVSVWVGILIIICYYYVNYEPLRLLAYALIVGRIGNYIHVAFACVRDVGINLKLNR